MESRGQQSGRRRSDQDAVDQRLRILAVDDDPAYLRFLNHVLTGAGFIVQTAPDGAAAIDRIRERCEVDLLLIDLKMPGIDGIETVRRIQSECPVSGLYTILLTADAAPETRLRALESGLDDFLSKQSSDSEIIAKIRSAARRLELERRLHVENEELQALALTDELTGVANRRALFRAAAAILGSSRQLTVVMFDLDRFKSVNDTYGHLAGDRILADVAAVFRTSTRFEDLIGRYGGDEFVLLLPDTDVEEAREIADRVLGRIQQIRWSIAGAVINIGAQYGVAASAGGGNLPDLLAECDQALYSGKRRDSGPSAPSPSA